jgi:hypothetical protein
MSPLFTLFIAVVTALGYVIFSAYLAAAYLRHNLVPAAWVGEEDRKPRSILLATVEWVASIFMVAMTQFLMVSIAIDSGESPVTRGIAGIELLVAVGWTGHVIAVLAGLYRRAMQG